MGLAICAIATLGWVLDSRQEDAIKAARFDTFVETGSLEDFSKKRRLMRRRLVGESCKKRWRRRWRKACSCSSHREKLKALIVRFFGDAALEFRASHPVLSCMCPTTADLALLSRPQRAFLLYVQCLYALAIC